MGTKKKCEDNIHTKHVARLTNTLKHLSVRKNRMIMFVEKVGLAAGEDMF